MTTGHPEPVIQLSHDCLRHPKNPYKTDGHFPSVFERFIYRTRNAIENRLYPFPLPIFMVIYVICFSYRLKNRAHGSELDFSTEIFIEFIKAMVYVYLPILVVRCIIKYFYFGYKRYLFEDSNCYSLITKFWFLFHRCFMKFSPNLCSCEALLPNLPVPTLKNTISRYLESIEPLHTEDELLQITKMAESFGNNEGRKLQLLTWLYSLFVDNYVATFWEKYAYHYSRQSLLINSSVAHLDLFEDIPASQALRAAHVVYIEALSMLSYDRQSINPIANGMISSSHYRKCYSTTRIPGEPADHLEIYGISRHAAVYYRGNIYKVDAFDENDQIHSLDTLTEIFNELLQRDQPPISGSEARLAALTTDSRNCWCTNRSKFFLNNPINRRSLEIIESAMFFVVLDQAAYDYDPEKPELLDDFMKNMLAGDGQNRWADKSLNYVISANGRCGGTTEHSIADGSEFDHIMENFAFMDNFIIAETYPSVQKTLGIGEHSVVKFKAPVQSKYFAERLQFDVNDELSGEIERCYLAHRVNIDNVDQASIVFRDFGKGSIKKCRISPDAFVQMAIQLANFKDQHKFSLTYESASAKFYTNSRTETMRTVSKQSCAFVRAMIDPDSDNNKRYELLREAAEVHVRRNKDCMTGNGVDRHLFVLYVFSKMFAVPSVFLDHYMAQQWLLSTSQAPKMTAQIDEDVHPERSWLGAGFGAVCRSGYGICYRFAGNHSICIHITSYRSANSTDSHRFMKHLTDSLNQMIQLTPTRA